MKRDRNDTTDDQRRAREERLAAELRANLARRKAQARARRGGEADDGPEGLATDTERGRGRD
ncbi:MAG: hypothetical protein K5872_07000 [Rhizobiaceae bacterium]|nr:hypothetical protein [Rhizobiaceae bacterium]MCV0405960.1 hypothetical protein [Rhizobiaceae bacterium]